jgi:hypothetical protein
MKFSLLPTVMLLSSLSAFASNESFKCNSHYFPWPRSGNLELIGTMSATNSQIQDLDLTFNN